MRWRFSRTRSRPLAKGDALVIGIVAEPGVGKSRLCYELAERCRNRGIEVYEAHAQAHGQAIPSCRRCRCCAATSASSDRDSDRVASEKIAGRLLLLDEGFGDDLPLIFEFLAVPDPDRPRRRSAPPPQRQAVRAG